MLIEKVKICFENRVPVTIHQSPEFHERPTYIVKVNEEGETQTVEVEGGSEAYPIRRVMRYFFEDDQQRPLSVCCMQIMKARHKPNPEVNPRGTTLDYIYCTGCNRKLDSAGIIKKPTEYHR